MKYVEISVFQALFSLSVRNTLELYAGLVREVLRKDVFCGEGREVKLTLVITGYVLKGFLAYFRILTSSGYRICGQWK